jgi:hypothetical protein
MKGGRTYTHRRTQQWVRWVCSCGWRGLKAPTLTVCPRCNGTPTRA